MDLFYQKYRPVKISDLDLKEVRENLTKILSGKNLPHAFLFAGPKGIGKTSAARAMAKSLNCPGSIGGKPCGRCPACLEIGRGESLDVLEIDAASNRGIDDIRSLKEKINLQPLKAKNKVYIVDEVHMLTPDAFNAILKTLEEPPEHVYFILCTTNPEKIPDTVLSRLTRIGFEKASDQEIIDSLKKVLKGEKIKVEKEILRLVAKSAEGSFRDAHKILYQLWLENKGKITLSAAQKALAAWEKATPAYLLSLLGKGKIKEAVVLFDQLAKQGVDYEQYGQRLIKLFQEMLLLKMGINSQDSQASTLSLELNFSLSKLTFLINSFLRALEEAKGSPFPWLSFQLVIIGLQEEKKGIKNREGGIRKEEEKKEEEKESLVRSGAEKQSLKLETIQEKWSDFLKEVKPLNHSVCALLRAARPREINHHYLVLEVFYPFHKEQLEQERNRRIVEEALSRLFTTSLRIKCELGKKPEMEAGAPLAVKKEDREEGGSEERESDDLYNLAKDIFGE